MSDRGEIAVTKIHWVELILTMRIVSLSRSARSSNCWPGLLGNTHSSDTLSDDQAPQPMFKPSLTRTRPLTPLGFQGSGN